MSEGMENSFVRDLLANPLDEVTARIYADWLDEHGQTDRAEAVRLYTALVNNRNAEGHRLTADERGSLLRRQRQVWHTLSLPPDGDGEVIVMSLAEYLANAHLMHGLAPESLRLLPEAERFTTAEQVGALRCQMPATVHSLDLSRHSISAINWIAAAEEIAAMSGLHALDLSDTQLADLDITGGVTQIESLGRLKNLHTLRLAGNALGRGTFGIGKIQAIAAMDHLRTLDLSNNGIGTSDEGDAEGIEQVAAIAGMKNLLELDLSGNPIADPSQPAIHRREKTRLLANAEMPYLKTLNLEQTGVETDEFLGFLAEAYRRTIETGGNTTSLFSLRTLSGESLPDELETLRLQAWNAFEAARYPALHALKTTLPQRRDISPWR